MNTPNKLTLLRVIMIPLFIFFYLYDFIPASNIIATVLFVAAFFTDWLDGYLARKTNQVTDFGKIMDPLADKVLVAAAMVCMTGEGIVNPWITIAVLAREFAVSGIRIAAAAEGNVVAASIWGKLKTMWQFIAITVALIFKALGLAQLQIIVDILMWINLALTVLSGIDYIVKNKKYLSYK
ncbi:MAG: CDP-diacylglycerol--glycerol-3-phosphate 3-phosphatidyltransferase [Clostridia bacterium]|nr:CDP-diacylglycerol--glycerol-3-phosphate 3-phosphatidyltransferase [Clostridia bacterium]